MTHPIADGDLGLEVDERADGRLVVFVHGDGVADFVLAAFVVVEAHEGGRQL